MRQRLADRLKQKIEDKKRTILADSVEALSRRQEYENEKLTQRKTRGGDTIIPFTTYMDSLKKGRVWKWVLWGSALEEEE